MNKTFVISTLLLLNPLRSYAELSFDISALEHAGSEITDATRRKLSQLGSQVPGTYAVDVVLNGETLNKSLIQFIECRHQLCPVLSLDQLTKWGIYADNINPTRDANAAGILNKPLSSLIDGADARMSQDASRLILTIPQQNLQAASFLARLAEVNQDGVPALFMSYYYNGLHSAASNQQESEQHFLNLNNGLNLGPWRLRQTAYLVQENKKKAHWRSQQTSIGRDIISIMSRVMLGQVSTPGRVFDSFVFCGATLTSIDEMLPDNQRSYAPVISGLALTQASVEVRQGGNLIYQQNVPPGPFTLTDVVPNSGSGDLNVIVRESSGEVRTFIQPYATQPKMVRKGQLRYAISSGEYEDGETGRDGQIFTQLESLYGVSNVATLFGGILASQGYQTVASGMGLNVGNFGGISLELDISRQRADKWRASSTGYSSKISYEKSIAALGTTFGTSLTENLDRHYATYIDYQTVRGNPISRPGNVQDIRRRWQFSISQNLDDFGSLSLNYYAQQSWNNRDQSRTLNASYSTFWRGISANINYSRSAVTSGIKYKDDVLSLNVTLPFSTLWGNPGQARINHSYTQSKNGLSQHQSTLSGSLLRGNNLNYSLTKTWASQQSGVSAQASYDGGYGSLNAAWSQTGNGNHQYSLGSSGSIVAHPGGVTLGQSIAQNDAFAIVSTQGARDVALSTRAGVATDWRGYAVVPSLTAYRHNSIGLDATTARSDITLKNTQLDVFPGFGTAISARFNTAIGKKAYLQIRHRNKPLPFGTELSGNGEGNGIVDEKGAAWITGIKEGEILTAHLEAALCSIRIDEKQLIIKNGVYTGIVTCN